MEVFSGGTNHGNKSVDTFGSDKRRWVSVDSRWCAVTKRKRVGANI
jgi:hypothetical protein